MAINTQQIVFNEIMEKINLSQSQLAMWMSLDNTKSTRNSVRRKSKGIVGITKTDIGLLRAIECLHDLGFDVRHVAFDDDLALKEPLRKRTD